MSLRRLLVLALVGVPCVCLGQDRGPQPPDPSSDHLRLTIQKHLGRPYVWGASGLKSFDCSGFVWRIMTDQGIFIKRTTARKFYLCLPEAPESDQWRFGNIIFFDNLKHCGLINDSRSFYHAQSKKGTNLSPLNRYWKPKVCGLRKMPLPAEAPLAASR